MKIRTGLGLCAAILAVAAPWSASADPLVPAVDLGSAYADALPPYEVTNIVRSSGFYPLGRPMRVGAIYQVRAIDPYEYGRAARRRCAQRADPRGA